MYFDYKINILIILETIVKELYVMPFSLMFGGYLEFIVSVAEIRCYSRETDQNTKSSFISAKS